MTRCRPFRRFRLLPSLTLGVFALHLASSALAQTESYFPDRNHWEHRTPEQVGMDPGLVAEAVAFAQASETSSPRDLERVHYQTFGREPNGDPIGPIQERGPQTGVILRHGYIVAAWGDPSRVDMTFSVSKSFLSTTVGLAWDRGLIQDVHGIVYEDVPITEFASPHNRTITWDHLLRQTSDWEGTLWGKPDWADRPPSDVPLVQYMDRERNAPGTSYKYNDVRVNVLALAALNVWRRPLPQVLREYVMDPIGASSTWRWHGYDNSWAVLDGQTVQSVSGGGHWGGGMFISAYDQARFGLFTLHRGVWNGRRLLSDAWFAMALTPGEINGGYGFMNFYLNPGRQVMPVAPASAFAHLGSGTNMIYVDAENDVVIVARWIDGRAMNGIVERVLGAIR